MFIYQWRADLEEPQTELFTDELWALGADGIEQRGEFVRAYFSAPTELETDLQEALGGDWHEEAEQDWQAEFKKTIQPVQAGQITIVAPWQRDQANEPMLVIEPGMAFGTGHHPTTRMAVTALSELAQAGGLNGRVLDVGTGSGILAMSAAKLGAAYSLGLDIDPITIPIARENALDNGLALNETIQFEEGSLGTYETDIFDVLVANLFAELHEALAESYIEHVVAGAPLILTGILKEKAEQVVEALEKQGITNIKQQEDGEWILITANTPL